MSEVESKINLMRNISLILYSLDSFIMILQAILIIEGISFTINTSYVQTHHILITFGGLPFLTVAFLIFAAIFDIAMIIAVEIMITRLLNYSVAVTVLTLIAAGLNIVINSLRAISSSYALVIRPIVEGSSAVIIAISVGALYSTLTLKKLEKRLSE